MWRHFVDKRVAYKFLHQGYYWPIFFSDAKKYVISCDSCQCMGRLVQADDIPLQHRVLIEPFEKWDLDFQCQEKIGIFWCVHILLLNG
jgi:hypothetical protein